jgi:acetoin utilization protein AcuB
MLVKDFMTPLVRTVGPGDSFSDVLRLMKKNHIKHVPVVEGSKVVGIISDRDIKEFGPSKATTLDIYELNYLLDRSIAREIMRSPVRTIPAMTPVEEAAMVLYDANIGCLPVVDGDARWWASSPTGTCIASWSRSRGCARAVRG